MCGIAGVWHRGGRPVEEGTLRAMASTLVHRGPDGEGVHRPRPEVGLAHRRLAIVDVEGGAQPLGSEDDTAWLTFNGEIFNHADLRRELEAKGHRFATRMDGEVILHLIEEEGTAGIERLRGQFAFGVWDGERLVLARDAMGIKPLYWLEDGDRFAFASEPRAFFGLPGFRPEPDLDGIRLYLRYRFIPAPVTGYRSVRKLRPGEILVAEPDGRVVSSRFGLLDPASVEDLEDLDEARERIRAELETSVARQLMSDVPLGAFLSGGLDSSTVAALMASNVDPLRTYTMGFSEASKDEREPARRVARHLGARGSEEVLDPARARELAPEILDHLDEPFGDASILPTYALAKLASRDVKVCLSGDGGDELFAGYGRIFRALQLLSMPPPLRIFHRIWRKIRHPPRDPATWRWSDRGDVSPKYHRYLTRTSRRDRKRLYGPTLRERLDEPLEDPVRDLFDRLEDLPPLARLLAVDLRSVLSEYHLVKVDRASMGTSLEVRVPLLDEAFVALAFRLSPDLRLHGGTSKGLLREAVADLLPSETLRRGKQGFGPPLGRWLAGPLADLVRDRLDGSRAVELGLLDRAALDDLRRPRRGKVKGSRVWRILVLESWLRGIEEGRFDQATVPDRGIRV